MIYKRFRIVVLARVMVFSASIFLFFYLLFKMQVTLYATIFILAIIIIYQLYSLIIYVERTNRDLRRFILTIKHEDFSQTFLGAGLGSSFDELKSAFNDVIQKFHKARADKEEHFRYLQTVVQHIGIGVMAFRNDGSVELINNAAKRLLKIPRLKNIKALEPLSKSLVKKLFGLKSGHKTLVKIDFNNELLQLAISATEFRMRDQYFTLVSLQNIQSELEEKELEAWQKLIRVLTHEIMNSITPIFSLASTVNEMLNINGGQISDAGISAETKDDIRGALQTIQRRSEGLLHFVDAYRNLTRVPIPNFQIFSIIDLFKQIQQLMQVEMSKSCINFQVTVIPESLELTADTELVEQVLINILKNAMQAVEGQKAAKIGMTAKIDDGGRINLQVSDNGPGISKDIIEKIFIPFFTTKENGTGIGLSLSRQIMRLHRGTVNVHSEPNEKTVFTLRF